MKTDEIKDCVRQLLKEELKIEQEVCHQSGRIYLKWYIGDFMIDYTWVHRNDLEDLLDI